MFLVSSENGAGSTKRQISGMAWIKITHSHFQRPLKMRKTQGNCRTPATQQIWKVSLSFQFYHHLQLDWTLQAKICGNLRSCTFSNQEVKTIRSWKYPSKPSFKTFSDPVSGFQYQGCESRSFGLVMMRASHPSCFNDTAPVALVDRLLLLALVSLLIFWMVLYSFSKSLKKLLFRCKRANRYNRLCFQILISRVFPQREYLSQSIQPRTGLPLLRTSG